MSDECDIHATRIIQREASDGIIAPAYSKEALEILKRKKKDKYNIIQKYQLYVPNPIEKKQVYGIIFEQGKNEHIINNYIVLICMNFNRYF